MNGSALLPSIYVISITLIPLKQRTASQMVQVINRLIAWHSQRPTISYSETKIFDKYFDQIFRKEYAPEKVQALNELSKCVSAKWINDNPMGLNESLLAMKAYAPHHHLFTISMFFCEVNKMPESVPNPAVAYELLKKNDLLDTMSKEES